MYLQDVAVLARKDLLLELRARETVPAMLLFVVSALVVFHFVVPSDLSEDTERIVSGGLLWVAIVFTAILGLTRAFAAERDEGLLDGLVMAPCDRSAIWLAKTLSVIAFLLVAEVIALPAFALFFTSVDAATVGAVLLANVGIAAVGSLLAAIAAASRTRELHPPVALSAARDSDRRRRRRGDRGRRSVALPLVPGPLRRDLCDHLVGLL